MDIKSLRVFLEQTSRYMQWADTAFAAHPVLRVEYEVGLCDNFQATMYSIHDFLGVRRQPVRPDFKKLATQSLREQVSNYDDVKKALSRTRFSQLFFH
jgi:hypothetical protein